jgi:Protein of unknown function (DUF1570)
MSARNNGGEISPRQVTRREWVRRAAAVAASGGAMGTFPARGRAAQERELAPADVAAKELDRAKDRVGKATTRTPGFATNERYQAVGDATSSFIKTTLADCELIAQDYVDHFRGKGFEIQRPPRRLTLVVFLEERPFREFSRKFAHNVPPSAIGFYSRSENWLVLYDIRNEPVNERGGAHHNVRTLAHEAMHQLTFNTGVLNRRGDVPFAIFEGLACYGEIRRLHGRTEPGQLNGPRLDDLAHLQRRADWIPVSDLLTHSESSFGTTSDEARLAYSQSWLLVYHLMKTPSRLPQFQSYLKAIYARTDTKHRLEDAQKSFGDLDRLDQELRREAIRLQKAPRP